MAEPVPGESKEAGCALCGSSWVNHWEAVDGKRLFFCCSLCSAAYVDSVAEVKRATGWPRVDRLFLDDVRGDEADGWASHAGKTVRFWVAGDDEGHVARFRLTEG